VGVLTFRNTVSEHDDLVWEITSLGLVEQVVRLGHTSEIGDDLPIDVSKLD
jgi:hypothetical protein